MYMHYTSVYLEVHYKCINIKICYLSLKVLTVLTIYDYHCKSPETDECILKIILLQTILRQSKISLTPISQHEALV